MLGCWTGSCGCCTGTIGAVEVAICGAGGASVDAGIITAWLLTTVTGTAHNRIQCC